MGIFDLNKNEIKTRLKNIDTILIYSHSELTLVEIWRLKDEYQTLTKKLKTIEARKERHKNFKDFVGGYKWNILINLKNIVLTIY